MGKSKWDRKFLGKTEDFESREEKLKEEKHLKAYMKGLEKYSYGFIQQKNPITGLMETAPAWHEVKQTLTKID